MEVIAVTENGNDFAVAVLKRHQILDPDFVAKVKRLAGQTRSWSAVSDDYLLDAQTFVAWFRSEKDPKASLLTCLENEHFAWSEKMLVWSDNHG